jgi:hypothetical protein
VLIKKGDLARVDEKPKSGPLNGSPLEGILADMLRSALAWEEEHGSSSESDGISPKTCSNGTEPTLLPIIIRGGDKHDHDDSRRE